MIAAAPGRGQHRFPVRASPSSQALQASYRQSSKAVRIQNYEEYEETHLMGESPEETIKADLDHKILNIGMDNTEHKITRYKMLMK